VIVVSDSEVLGMFVTVDCEGTARHISEWYKRINMEVWKENTGIKRKISTSIYLGDSFIRK
jgi:hypothetical protein